MSCECLICEPCDREAVREQRGVMVCGPCSDHVDDDDCPVCGEPTWTLSEGEYECDCSQEGKGNSSRSCRLRSRRMMGVMTDYKEDSGVVDIQLPRVQNVPRVLPGLGVVR